MKKDISQLRKELFTIKNRRENNYTSSTIYDKHGNKFSMQETAKEVDEGKITQFARYKSTSI